MDVIQRAIFNKRHITGRSELRNQDWNEFEKIIHGQKLYLFGLGVGADYFLSKYKKKVQLR